MSPPGDETVIAFQGVAKRYDIVRRATPRLGAWVVDKLFEHLRREPFWALGDVSFEIARGESVGFLGVNGAGKSTALKLIAGITQPTYGTVRTRGRIASLLELGIGFHPELTGMENIFYNAAMMGLSRDEVMERLEEIVEFSGLCDFLYEPVKHYSSGMYARLGVSVAMHLDPDIVLLDEILAVGDAEFQQRGMNRLLELHERGVTIVLVSHALAAARELCGRLIWLDHGRVRADGRAADVAREYQRHVHSASLPPRHFLNEARPVVRAEGAERRTEEKGPWTHENAVKIAGVALESAGTKVGELETGKPARFVFEIEGASTAPAPFRLAFNVRWPDGRELFHEVTPPMAAGPDTAPIVYEVESWPYLRGEMTVGAALLGEDGEQVLDRSVELAKFRTETDEAHYLPDCLIAPPVTWEADESAV